MERAASDAGLTPAFVRHNWRGSARARVIAGAALRALTGAPASVIADAVNCHPVQLAPSQLLRAGVSAEDVERFIASLDAPVEPISRSRAPLVRPMPSKPVEIRQSPQTSNASVIDIEARRAREAVRLSAREFFHRTNADRRSPRAVVTAELMGDPRPGQPIPSQMTERQIAQRNREFLKARGINAPGFLALAEKEE